MWCGNGSCDVYFYYDFLFQILKIIVHYLESYVVQVFHECALIYNCSNIFSYTTLDRTKVMFNVSFFVSHCTCVLFDKTIVPNCTNLSKKIEILDIIYALEAILHHGF